jgi:hypothetical protein
LNESNLLTFLIFGMIVIYFGTMVYRRVQTGRQREKLGDKVEMLIPISGMNAFLGISSKGLVSSGNWQAGYEGNIPIAKIRQIKYEAGMSILTVPRLTVDFIDEQKQERNVRFLGLGALGGSVAGGSNQLFAQISNKAIARWEEYKKKNP